MALRREALTDDQVRDQVLRSLLTLRVMVGFLVLVVGLIVSHQLGESARIGRAVDSQTARLEMDIRADCAFKLDIIRLPAATPNPGAVLLQLAADARVAYISKRCAGTRDPITGVFFPQPPPVPGPSPTR